MLIGNPIDTLMNLAAFAFIGAMVWLCLRPLAPPKRDAEDRNEIER